MNPENTSLPEASPASRSGEDSGNSTGEDGPGKPVSRRIGWCLFGLYLAIWGSFCGLEVDTYVGDLPFFQANTFLLLINVLSVLLIPAALYLILTRTRPFQNRHVRAVLLVLGSVYIHLVSFLALYKSVRKADFDFYFFWYNTADALPALWKLFAPWFVVVVVSLAAVVFFQKHAFAAPAGRRIYVYGIAAVVMLSLAGQAMTFSSLRGSAAGFLYSSFFTDRSLRNSYHDLYREHVSALMSEAPESTEKADTSLVGEVVFFIKQESLNGVLAGNRVTPQLLRAAEDGVFFPESYANSVQSLRGYECLLCGVPPNLERALVDEYPTAELKKLNCLPRLFRNLGYTTLYFFGGSRNPRIMRFADAIGFEKVIADEIAHPDDAKFDWGYREDVFFKRVFEYLERYSGTEKLFVFIDTGATNHTPFEVLDEALLDKVPFPNPETFEEHLSNTTFVQDAYFGQLYDRFRERYAGRGSILVASDHSWPIPRHENNIYNERGAYEENFLIPMLFVPPAPVADRFKTGRTVEHRYSQMDILPTFLDLIGIRQRHLLGESFETALLGHSEGNAARPNRMKLSVQPYGGGFISAVSYPEKYLFDVLGQSVSRFDLEKDPGEMRPVVYGTKEYVPLIRKFFTAAKP